MLVRMHAHAPWDSPGKSTGVGCHALLQGIFPTEGSNSLLLPFLHCRKILYRWATGEAQFTMDLMASPEMDSRHQEREQNKKQRERNNLAKEESRESVILEIDQGSEHFVSVLSPSPDH